MQFTDEEIVNSLSRLDEAALILLSENSAAPVEGNTAYQKELFFISRYDEDIGADAAFDSYKYGPYSEAADNAIDNLIALGIAEPQKNSTANTYTLTEYGKKIADIVKQKTTIDREEIADIKEFFSGLTQKEFILFTYVLYPEYTSESEIKTEIIKKRIPLSISLYKKGKVGIEMAAHLSDLSIEKFLDTIRAQKGAA